MKTLLILLISACTCWAQMGLRSPAWVAAATKPNTSCATTDTSLPHDTLLEGWQGDGTEQTWTAAGGDANITLTPGADSSALTSGKPDGACDKAFSIVHADGGVTGTSYYWDKGSIWDVSAQSFDTYFYIYVAANGLPSGGTMGIIGWNSAATVNFNIGVLLNNAAGTTKLIAQGANNSAAVTITTGAWHKVKLHCDTTDTACYIEVDDGGTGTTFQRGASDPRYLHIGCVSSVGTGDNCTVYIDVICAEAL